MERQASSGLTTRPWHTIHWAACHRQGRSLQRRSVQAVPAGAGRKGKRLRSLVVHAVAARAFAVTRVTEQAGTKTPGVENDLWDTPEKNATAVSRRGQWRGYRPRPLQRLSMPQKNGTQRPLSMPPMEDRARHAVSLHTLQPRAETTAAPHAYGCRPTRRCADASDHGWKVLRQPTSATGILAGESAGFCDHIALAWLEKPIPMNQRVLSTWLSSGVSERGAVFPTTAGVPQGGMVSPVMSPMGLDGLADVGHGGIWPHRVHQITDVRGADDFLVTAHARAVVAETVRPSIHTCLAARGVRLSPHQTVIPPLSQGCDCFGQTIRTSARPHGTPAQLQMTPRQARVPTIPAQLNTRCHQAAGTTPTHLIAPLNPVWRGWANSHRHSICGDTCAHRDSFVWRRLSRWATLRHPHKTGRWIAQRSFPPQRGASWRFPAPTTGTHLLRLQETGKPPRHIQGKSDANPFDPCWEAYLQYRDRQVAVQASSALRAKLLHQQTGRCPLCRQVIQGEEPLALHHRDGTHQHNRREHLVLLPPNGHRQGHSAPDSTTTVPRPSRGVGHA